MKGEMARGLRWLLFVIGVGSLVAAGIYLGSAVADDGTLWRLLRGLMFMLLGLFFVLMYGEHRSATGSTSAGER